MFRHKRQVVNTETRFPCASGFQTYRALLQDSFRPHGPPHRSCDLSKPPHCHLCRIARWQTLRSQSWCSAGQCEGNNREDEVGVLCECEVSGGSSNVRHTCARDHECFGDIAHKDHCDVSLSHARKKIAESVRRAVHCLHHPSLTCESPFPVSETPCEQKI